MRGYPETISHFYMYYVTRNPRQCAVFFNLSIGVSRLVIVFDVSHVVVLDPLDPRFHACHCVQISYLLEEVYHVGVLVGERLRVHLCDAIGVAQIDFETVAEPSQAQFDVWAVLSCFM